MSRTGAAWDALTAVEPAVAGLAALLELRDGYAAADARQMVELSHAIGERLGLDLDELDDLQRAACLHDIGKIGVPDRILHKPGKLDPEERVVMDRHPVWGAEALQRIAGMEGVALLVRSHHERWDGSGYPAGLVGEATPTGARIIGVCETYRALTSERPYRRSLEAAKAVSVIQAAAGSHFDPVVVDALVAVLGERGITPRPQGSAGARGARFARSTPEPRGYGRRLPDAFKRLDGLPALAESRDRLLALLCTERASSGEIVAAVESDPALAIAVLRLANGRAGRRGTIAGIPEAVRVLSPEGVEMLASRITVTDMLDPGSGWGALPELLGIHSVTTRQAADRLAAAVGHEGRDELLVCALLHDVGKVALALAHPGYPDEIHDGAHTPEDRVRAERHKLGIDHAVVGGVLLRRWGLPDRLAVIVEGHHNDDARQDAALLRLADLLAHYSHGRSVDARVMRTVAGSVGLDAARLRAVMFEHAAGGSARPRAGQPCPLTPNQLQAVRHVAAGKVYDEIAREMGVSTSTVRSHLHAAYRRLDVPDRAQAVLTCTREGWL